MIVYYLFICFFKFDSTMTFLKDLIRKQQAGRKLQEKNEISSMREELRRVWLHLKKWSHETFLTLERKYDQAQRHHNKLERQRFTTTWVASRRALNLVIELLFPRCNPDDAFTFYTPYRSTGFASAQIEIAWASN